MQKDSNVVKDIVRDYKFAILTVIAGVLTALIIGAWTSHSSHIEQKIEDRKNENKILKTEHDNLKKETFANLAILQTNFNELQKDIYMLQLQNSVKYTKLSKDIENIKEKIK